MKNIKYKIFVLVSTLSISFLMTSCSDDFLDTPSVNQPTAFNYYQDDKQLDAAVVSAYSAFANKGMYKDNYFIVRDLLSDDVTTTEPANAAHYGFLFTSGDETISKVWKNLFIVIGRANIVIEKAPIAPEATDEVKTRVIGEATFLRALAYWHLVTMFGDVPIIKQQLKAPYHINKSKAEQVWDFIESDLKTVVDSKMLPLINGKGAGRATHYAACALLGKVQLFRGKYNDAIPNFDQVIKSGKYSLLLPSQIWTTATENGLESIFEIQYSRIPMLSNVSLDDHVIGGEGTERNKFLGPKQAGAWQNLIPSKNLVDVYESGDLRRSAFIWAPGDSIKVTDFSKPIDTLWGGAIANKGDYGIKKGMGTTVYSGDPGGFEQNFPIIRYVDVLLMKAECLHKTSDDAGAKLILDQIRARSFKPDSLKTVDVHMAEKGWTSVMDVIKQERRVELAFECHRYNDLVRWGDAATVLGPRGWSVENKYYPIPQSDIDRTDGTLNQY